MLGAGLLPAQRHRQTFSLAPVCLVRMSFDISLALFSTAVLLSRHTCLNAGSLAFLIIFVNARYWLSSIGLVRLRLGSSIGALASDIGLLDREGNGAFMAFCR